MKREHVFHPSLYCARCGRSVIADGIRPRPCRPIFRKLRAFWELWVWPTQWPARFVLDRRGGSDLSSFWVPRWFSPIAQLVVRYHSWRWRGHRDAYWKGFHDAHRDLARFRAASQREGRDHALDAMLFAFRAAGWDATADAIGELKSQR